MPEPLRPSYYLVHDTPAGQRYAYPLPAIPQEASWAGAKEDAWSSPDGPIEYVPGPARSWEIPTTGWLIADRPLTSVALRWTEGAGLSGRWRKLAELSTTDPVIVAAWKNAPDEPTADELEHLRADHDEDGCLTCAITGRVYGRVANPRVPREHNVDLTGWRPLPGTPDPDVNRPWAVADPSVLTVYGWHTAHLWPGHMAGLRTAVFEAIVAHPLVQAVGYKRGGFDHTVYHWEREGKISVSVPIRWDVPQKRPREKRDRGRGPFLAPIAMTHQAKHDVPDLLAAESKAAALAGWDASVARWVGKFLPDSDEPLTACSACRGRGFHLPGVNR